MESTHGEVLLLVKLQILKVKLPHGCFSFFLNCANVTKSCKAPRMIYGVFYFCATKEQYFSCHYCFRTTLHNKTMPDSAFSYILRSIREWVEVVKKKPVHLYRNQSVDLQYNSSYMSATLVLDRVTYYRVD